MKKNSFLKKEEILAKEVLGNVLLIASELQESLSWWDSSQNNGMDIITEFLQEIQKKQSEFKLIKMESLNFQNKKFILDFENFLKNTLCNDLIQIDKEMSEGQISSNDILIHIPGHLPHKTVTEYIAERGDINKREMMEFVEENFINPFIRDKCKMLGKIITDFNGLS